MRLDLSLRQRFIVIIFSFVPGVRIAELLLPRKGMRAQSKISGGDIEEVTPDPIPNSEVKLFGADGTARET